MLDASVMCANAVAVSLFPHHRVAVAIPFAVTKLIAASQMPMHSSSLMFSNCLRRACYVYVT